MLATEGDEIRGRRQEERHVDIDVGDQRARRDRGVVGEEVRAEEAALLSGHQEEEDRAPGAKGGGGGDARGFTLIPDPMPEEVIFVRSDQYSFVRQGVPSIYLTAGSGTVGGGDAQAKASGAFFAQHYHQPSDESELGADWDSAARFTAAQADLIRAIADADARPTWNAGDFFGETFGRK